MLRKKNDHKEAVVWSRGNAQWEWEKKIFLCHKWHNWHKQTQTGNFWILILAEKVNGQMFMNENIAHCFYAHCGRFRYLLSVDHIRKIQNVFSCSIQICLDLYLAITLWYWTNADLNLDKIDHENIVAKQILFDSEWRMNLRFNIWCWRNKSWLYLKFRFN